jgi:hypothetical protein
MFVFTFFFISEHYDSCVEKSLSSANSSESSEDPEAREAQRSLTTWLKPSTARTSTSSASNERRTSPPEQETTDEDDPLELQDKDLSLK